MGGCCRLFGAGVRRRRPTPSRPASLRGRVTDEQGAVVPGAADRGAQPGDGRGAFDGHATQGEYLLPALPVGSYRLEVQSTRVPVAVMQNLRARGGAGRGAEREAVGRRPHARRSPSWASRPRSRRSPPPSGTVIDQKTVQEIPLNGRHFVDLGLLIPGSVAPQPATGFLTAPLRGQGSFAFNTAGNREDTVNFMINGINLNDQVQNQITFQPLDQHRGRVQGRQLDAQRRVRAQLGRRREHRHALGHATTTTARRSSSSATSRSTRELLQPRRASRSRRSTATSSAATSAARSSRTRPSSS